MALAGFYKHMNLTEEQLREVEDELRKARMFEVLTITSSMRQAEIDEIRRRLMEQERIEEERRRQLPVQTQLLRQRAFEALQREAEATRMSEAERLAADRRLLLQREKEVLMQRRRRFEIEQSEAGFSSAAGGGAASAGPATPRSAAAAAANGPPVLVMNVSLGNGKEDRIIVRQNDDPKKVAVQFARKHKLPEHAVSNLTAQIRTNLSTSSLAHTRGVGAGHR